MNFAIGTLKKEELRQKLPVILMEIDYELLSLYDAMQEEDHGQIIKLKEKLKSLREQRIQLEQIS